MAQTGYTPISIYYSATGGNTPTAGNLVAGELAINTADGKLFYKDSAGVVQVIAGKGGAGVAGGSNTQVQYNSSGSLAGSANMTFDGTTLTAAGLSDSGNLTFTGTGNRIRGDFSNATFANRVYVQTSTSGGNTVFGLLPDAGNATPITTFEACLSSDPANTNTTQVQVTTTDSRINAGLRGTASALPLTMYTSNTERLRIDTSGNVGIGTSSPTKQLTVANDASISGLTVGKGGGAVTSNTAVGYQAINASATGTQLSAFGFGALYSNTTGNYNSASGYGALFANTTGASNTAVGTQALTANTTASNNTAVGYQAAYSNTTGTENTAVGKSALQASTTANNNVAFGYQAGYANTTGAQNTYIGTQAGHDGTTGKNNTCVGLQAGYSLTTGSGNTFVGPYNDANGYAAGYFVTTGSKNTILGNYSGNQGGLDIRTASNYIVLSDGDGNPRGYCNGNGTWSFPASPPAGNRNVQITNSLNASNSQALGITLGTGTADTNSYFIVSSSAGSDRMYVFGNGNIVNTNNSYGTLSDIKLKENIVDASAKLNDVMKLKVRNFNLKSDPDHKQIGFIAQELEQIFPAMVDESPDFNEDGVDLGTVTKSIKTSVLVPILVKAIQELKAEIDLLKGAK
jgi:hypothetical protein